MKKILCYLKLSVWGVVLLGTITSNAQQSGITVQQDQINGKQVYRQSQKLYESKSGTSRSSKPQRVGENLKARIEYERQLLVDPNTGLVPKGIREAEVKFSDKIKVSDVSRKSLATTAKSSSRGRFSYWKNRGPWNVGGRTRALAIDRTNENVILAGGVSGGLWRSEDGGQSWRKVTRRFQNPSITAIVQDPRPGKSFTWYYASGETIGNSARDGGADFRGEGVYKSRDGGRTWEKLRSTDDGDPTTDSNFDLINSIEIHPVTGDVYLASYTGIQRSQDGGRTFTQVLEGGTSTLAEVHITATGQIYATMDDNSEVNNGIFTSSDGDTWTKINPDFIPAQFLRTVMGSDPSNGNIVYFFMANRGNNTPQSFLFKYDAAAEEKWTDLTVNLPVNFGSRGGVYNIQGGYDMLVKVSPADSNMVFIGGTNLYRSMDGFTTPVGPESWIGGYTSANGNSFGLYTDQHPDQHALVFYPSNPNKVLSGHDGGVSVTEDITTSLSGGEPVDWTSLSNGYLTTQPYHVSFDPEANSDDLAAGFQDNSTWYTNSTDGVEPWVDLFGGDGSYSAISDGGRTRYVSSQLGSIFRFNYDEAGVEQAFTRITPAGASGFAFIAPFVLDPNNDNIMYLPAGRRIWRNNNLDEVPLFNNSNATVNWVNLENSEIPGNPDPNQRDFSISSLDVSKYPIANRLYYGTSNGTVFRMDNANVDGQVAVDLTTGKGLPSGFVTDINVDPSNSDRVIVTYSNYNIPSLFLTENGGETWTDISGNLEQNRDGTGDGPSVRSTAFLGGSQGFLGARVQRVFAGTSTGLYSTSRLNGSNTVWRKENIVIGNNVIPEVATRKDGFIAAAAHGNGLFSARFPIFNQLPESSLSVAYLLDDVTADINSLESFEVNVDGLFVNSNGGAINVELQNTNSDLVTATLEGNTLSIEFTGQNAEIGDKATIVLLASSGNEEVAEGFTITVSELPIYNQEGGGAGSSISQFFPDFGALLNTADDFSIPEGDTWTIERVLAFGAVNNSPALTNATVVVYENNAGVPGEEIYNSGQIAPLSDPNDTNLNLALPEPLILESGNYWISVYVNLTFNPGATQWFWSSQNAAFGQESLFRDEFDLFGVGAVDWTPTGSIFSDRPVDQVFNLYGTISGGDNETAGSEPATLATLDVSNTAVVSPNPSSDRFTFNLNNFKSQEKVSIAVYNITGNMIYQRNNLSSNFEWDASRFNSGFYFVKISKASGEELTFKLLKK
ncbi:T9SS type A sorting domain-containing protein [Aquimarina mytili]|uniref:T9SS type A sorting domain-containing protein n=1 Tax=Aquimarina mytili TaxID=874423 RepID=A0A937DC68_9FLAO|nr:T9SS type A sorting domain-containing protein [Aquimarina mytili]MBL0684611.1 T9SS type A sorting domain-containing protein [Aquimarina mytili]